MYEYIIRIYTEYDGSEPIEDSLHVLEFETQEDKDEYIVREAKYCLSFYNSYLCASGVERAEKHSILGAKRLEYALANNFVMLNSRGTVGKRYRKKEVDPLLIA